METHSFKNHRSDVQHLIHAINTIGDNLVGLELGVFRGESSMTILHNCSIKKLYLIDHWKPYYDFIKAVPDGRPSKIVNQIEAELNELLTRHAIKYSGMSEKVEIIKEDSLDAVRHIEDESLDFIFFDAMLSEEQSFAEAMAYYRKIKKGGFFMGHDSDSVEQVMKPIERIKNHYNNNNSIHVYINSFLFKI
jgi:predicted O-methyltransferase YrrM|tara:strand:- start:895 stop:1470 length:576 start_codon:yes stop_codon:yes gene_type:complete